MITKTEYIVRSKAGSNVLVTNNLERVKELINAENTVGRRAFKITTHEEEITGELR